MKPIRALAALVAFTLTVCAVGPRPIARAADAPARVPVLVELFTSEGCASCPPADALLRQLLHAQPVAGAQIVALGEHVDYWNGPGWTDPFSQHAFSVRQNEYAASFHNSEVYTPQMVVDGRAEFVGSDAGRASEAIARAARAPKAPVQLTVNGPVLTVNVPAIPTATPSDKAEVWLATTQDHLTSHVTGGENRGRTLTHTAVTRSLRLLGTVPAGRPFAASVPFPTLPDGTKGPVVVFVQERMSRRVLAVGRPTLEPFASPATPTG